MNVTTSLIEGLRSHSKMEEDRESVLPIEDEFRDFRSRVRELLRDIVFLVGTEGLVQHLTIQFVNSCSGDNWEDIEVDLFFISCLVHELFDRDGNSTHDQVIARVIMEVISATTVTDGPVAAGGHVLSLKLIKTKGDEDTSNSKLHPQILATACDIFSELSVWLKMRSPFLGNILSFLFHVIISSKTIPDLMIAATGALEPIIESCFAPVEESLDRRAPDPSLEAEDLLGTDERPALISICSQLDSLSNEDAAHHLLQSAANLISSLGSKSGKTMSPQDVRIRQEDLMCKLMHPHLDRLRPEISLTADPTQDLDRVTSLFRPLKLVPIQSGAPLPLEQVIVTTVWPRLEKVLETYCTKSDRIIERACRTLRYILRSVRPVTLIIPVTEKISQLFQLTRARHSCFLYVLSILVDEFVPSSIPGVANTCGLTPEDGEKIANWMIGLIQELSNPTFVFLTQQGTRIRDHPDTIDDFFRLCMRFIQKRPEMFADKFSSHKTFQDILELAYYSLEIDQREANHSVTRFLSEFFESLQDKNTTSMPTCPPTTPSPFSQSTMASIRSASSSSSSLTGGDLNLNAIEKSRLIIVENFAARLTDRVMTVSLFSLPSYFIPDFADVMYALIQLDRAKAYEWVKTFFSGAVVAAKMQESVATASPDAVTSMQQQLQSSFDSLISAKHAKGMTQTLRSIHRLFRSHR